MASAKKTPAAALEDERETTPHAVESDPFPSDDEGKAADEDVPPVLRPSEAEEVPARKKRVVPPTPPPDPPPVLYRVRGEGTLKRNGKVFRPGDELSLEAAEGDAIACLERVNSG